MENDYQILDSCYPQSFLSSSTTNPFQRLPLLSRDVLLRCVRRFRECVPTNCRVKADYINIIHHDFAEQTSILIQSSTADLYRLASPASDSNCRLLPVCQVVHNRYGNVVASQLLSSPARWNPPQVPQDQILKPAWFGPGKIHNHIESHDKNRNGATRRSPTPEIRLSAYTFRTTSSVCCRDCDHAQALESCVYVRQRPASDVVGPPPVQSTR
jgi:hypothetical protein